MLWKVAREKQEKELYGRERVPIPAREVYSGLSSDQERLVMQALALYDKPVPGAAIRTILPALPVDEILDKLVYNLVVNYDPGCKCYWAHPVDRQYAYSQIPVHGNYHSKPALHKLAAQFYLSFPCLPRGSRTSVDDIMAMLDAIEHLIAADQAEIAVELLLDHGIDEDLQLWGQYLLLTDLYRQLLSRAISSEKRIALHIRLGKIYRNLGELEEARKTYEGALPFIADAVSAENRIGLVIALGDISRYLGDADRALEYHQQAEELLFSNPDPLLQSENTGDWANVMLDTGDYEEAHRLYERAIESSQEANNKTYEGIWNGGLGALHETLFSDSGESIHRERAVLHYVQAISLAKETQDRRHESHWKGVLGNFYRQLGEYELARAHVQEALSISAKICYRRMIPTQVRWMAAVFGECLQKHIENRDFETSLQVAEAFLQQADEIGNDDLKKEANRQFGVVTLNKIAFLLQEGSFEEAIEEGREFIMFWEGKAGILVALGSMSMKWGRKSGNEKVFELGVEAYTKGIALGPDDSLERNANPQRMEDSKLDEEVKLRTS